MIWGQLALICAIKDSGENIGVIESYRRAWRKILSYWWVTFLTTSIVLGGSFLFVVPGIIFSVWFSMAVYILVAEDIKGMDALMKSREYVRGRWLSVFWRFLFLSLLAMIFLLPLSLISKFIPFSSFVELVFSLFFAPLSATYLFLIYSNLKSVKGDFVFEPAKIKKWPFILTAIIGLLIVPATILTLIVFTSMDSAREKARDARRQSDIMQIQMALELYQMDNNSYPSSLDELSSSGIYSSTIIDSKTKKHYQYKVLKEGSDYEICAEMETKEKKCLTPWD